MDQVISNLLGNAIKFTAEGERIEIAAKFYDGFVSILVSDTGVGISEGELPHFFDRYWQVKDTAKKEMDWA